jgi:hypothetical protein
MEEVTYCSECRYAYRNESGERNPNDIICTYWRSDGLTQFDYCSKGEAGEYTWDENCIEDTNDFEVARR